MNIKATRRLSRSLKQCEARGSQSLGSVEAARRLSRSLKQPYGRVRRSKAICLYFVERRPITEIAMRLEVNPQSVREWLHRFQVSGVGGLYERRGLPNNPKQVGVAVFQAKQLTFILPSQKNEE